MTKAFRKVEATKKRTINYMIRLTEEEAETIRTSALVRKLSVAEFMRRAALGRKADVNYETEIIRMLNDSATIMIDMTTIMRESKIAIPVTEMRELMAYMTEAVKKIDNI